MMGRVALIQRVVTIAVFGWFMVKGSSTQITSDWAASRLEDTLFKCQIQPEYVNGHYQKEVQQGI